MLIESFNAYHISLHYGVFLYSNNILSTREKQMRGDKMTSSKYKRVGNFILNTIWSFGVYLVFILSAKSALIALGNIFKMFCA